MVPRLPSLTNICSQTLTVVLMEVVISGCALGPLNTKLLSAEYDHRIAASRLTEGLDFGWANHHLTVTVTAA